MRVVLNTRRGLLLNSSDSWQGVNLGPKQRLFRVQHFFLMSGGKNYNIEVQDDGSGGFAAHADNTSDPHDPLPTCHGKSLTECLQNMVAEIAKRSAP
jgi:hypothetical protein